MNEKKTHSNLRCIWMLMTFYERPIFMIHWNLIVFFYNFKSPAQKLSKYQYIYVLLS